MHDSEATPWLLPFLRQIQPRPGMYIGHESTRLLWQYLMGYCQARLDLGISVFGVGEPDHLTLFTAWLRRRHAHGRTTMGCCDMIERLDPSDRNLPTFFKEFDDYLVESGVDPNAIEARLPTSWLLE